MSGGSEALEPVAVSIPASAAIAGQRLDGLDAVKGLAIALVVAIHSAPSGEPGYVEHFVNGPARLAVPLFYGVTGFLIGVRWPSQAKLAAGFRTFLRLHVLYSLFYWVLEPWRLPSAIPLTPKSVVMKFGMYAYSGQFFLFSLVPLYFLVAYVVPERRRGDAAWPLLSLALAVVTIGWLASSGDGSGGEVERIAFAHLQQSIAVWLFPFTLGIWLGHRIGVLPPRPGIAAAAFAAACALGALDVPQTGGPGFAALVPYARWSLLIGSALLVVVLPVLAAAPRSALLSALGRESFGIFVFNSIVIHAIVSAIGAPQTLAGSLLLAAAALAVAYAVTRFLRPRLRFAFP
jgi:surface polysaccharide O-acyltransferase-like enzyme